MGKWWFDGIYPLVVTFTVSELERGPVEIVSLESKNCDLNHSFVKLPDGIVFHESFCIVLA